MKYVMGKQTDYIRFGKGLFLNDGNLGIHVFGCSQCDVIKMAFQNPFF